MLWVLAAEKLLLRYGITIDQKEKNNLYNQMLGISAENISHFLKQQYKLRIPQPEILAQEIKLVIELYKTNLQLIPGALDTLKLLKNENISLAIASNSDPDSLAISIAHLNLIEFFGHHVYDVSMVSQPKPYPDLYLLAMDKLNVGPKECIVFEDSPHGISAAYEAKIQTIIAINSSKNKDALHQATHIIESFEDILTI
jgi:HAD superfamily hydrolase (TIGR01509 family)